MLEQGKKKKGGEAGGKTNNWLGLLHVGSND